MYINTYINIHTHTQHPQINFLFMNKHIHTCIPTHTHMYSHTQAEASSQPSQGSARKLRSVVNQMIQPQARGASTSGASAKTSTALERRESSAQAGATHVRAPNKDSSSSNNKVSEVINLIDDDDDDVGSSSVSVHVRPSAPRAVTNGNSSDAMTRKTSSRTSTHSNKENGGARMPSSGADNHHHSGEDVQAVERSRSKGGVSTHIKQSESQNDRDANDALANNSDTDISKVMADSRREGSETHDVSRTLSYSDVDDETVRMARRGGSKLREKRKASFQSSDDDGQQIKSVHDGQSTLDYTCMDGAEGDMDIDMAHASTSGKNHYKQKATGKNDAASSRQHVHDDGSSSGKGRGKASQTGKGRSDDENVVHDGQHVHDDGDGKSEKGRGKASQTKNARSDGQRGDTVQGDKGDAVTQTKRHVAESLRGAGQGGSSSGREELAGDAQRAAEGLRNYARLPQTQILEDMDDAQDESMQSKQRSRGASLDSQEDQSMGKGDGPVRVQAAKASRCIVDGSSTRAGVRSKNSSQNAVPANGAEQDDTEEEIAEDEGQSRKASKEMGGSEGIKVSLQQQQQQLSGDDVSQNRGSCGDDHVRGTSNGQKSRESDSESEHNVSGSGTQGIHTAGKQSDSSAKDHGMIASGAGAQQHTDMVGMAGRQLQDSSVKDHGMNGGAAYCDVEGDTEDDEAPDSVEESELVHGTSGACTHAHVQQRVSDTNVISSSSCVIGGMRQGMDMNGGHLGDEDMKDTATDAASGDVRVDGVKKSGGKCMTVGDDSIVTSSSHLGDHDMRDAVTDAASGDAHTNTKQVEGRSNASPKSPKRVRDDCDGRSAASSGSAEKKSKSRGTSVTSVTSVAHERGTLPLQSHDQDERERARLEPDMQTQGQVHVKDSVQAVRADREHARAGPAAADTRKQGQARAREGGRKRDNMQLEDGDGHIQGLTKGQKKDKPQGKKNKDEINAQSLSADTSSSCASLGESTREDTVQNNAGDSAHKAQHAPQNDKAGTHSTKHASPDANKGFILSGIHSSGTQHDATNSTEQPRGPEVRRRDSQDPTACVSTSDDIPHVNDDVSWRGLEMLCRAGEVAEQGAGSSIPTNSLHFNRSVSPKQGLDQVCSKRGADQGSSSSSSSTNGRASSQSPAATAAQTYAQTICSKQGTSAAPLPPYTTSSAILPPNSASAASLPPYSIPLHDTSVAASHNSASSASACQSSFPDQPTFTHIHGQDMQQERKSTSEPTSGPFPASLRHLPRNNLSDTCVLLLHSHAPFHSTGTENTEHLSWGDMHPHAQAQAHAHAICIHPAKEPPSPDSAADMQRRGTGSGGSDARCTDGEGCAVAKGLNIDMQSDMVGHVDGAKSESQSARNESELDTDIHKGAARIDGVENVLQSVRKETEIDTNIHKGTVHIDGDESMLQSVPTKTDLNRNIHMHTGAVRTSGAESVLQSAQNEEKMTTNTENTVRDAGATDADLHDIAATAATDANVAATDANVAATETNRRHVAAKNKMGHRSISAPAFVSELSRPGLLDSQQHQAAPVRSPESTRIKQVDSKTAAYNASPQPQLMAKNNDASASVLLSATAAGQDSLVAGAGQMSLVAAAKEGGLVQQRDKVLKMLKGLRDKGLLTGLGEHTYTHTHS
jgi:hypothetical protein